MTNLTVAVLVLIAVIYIKTTREQWNYQTQSAIAITIKYSLPLMPIIYINQFIALCMITQIYLKIVQIVLVFTLLCVTGFTIRYLMDQRAQQPGIVSL